MKVVIEKQMLYSDMKNKNVDGTYKLTPRVVMWLTPDGIEEFMQLKILFPDKTPFDDGTFLLEKYI